MKSNKQLKATNGSSQVQATNSSSGIKGANDIITTQNNERLQINKAIFEKFMYNYYYHKINSPQVLALPLLIIKF